MPRGSLWLSRPASRHRARGKLDDIGAYARFEVNLPGGAFPVVVADVHPGLLRPRSRQLDEVLQHALGRTDAVLVGDFNTPLESVFLDAFRARFTSALEAAGTGFRETWPCGLPLLSLDQVWAGADWQVLEARKIWRLTGSDHAALYVRLRRR
jgi:endonuclease/exonuclease/phosphatase (EEP) superfamily protein YafD